MESRGSQTIIRTVKDRSNPYVIVNNTVFTDPRISWKAKGLMGYFLSRPDDWRIAVRDLVQRSRDGREAVYAGLRELIENGYIVRSAVRGDGGRIVRWEYLVYETPQAKDGPQGPQPRAGRGFSPLTGFPEVAKPDLANPPQPNTEYNQVLIKNNDDRNREAVAKVSSSRDTSRVRVSAHARAKTAPPAAAVVVESSGADVYNNARPPLVDEPAAAATDAVKAKAATGGGPVGASLDSAGGGKNQPLRGPGVSDPEEAVRARYREITGLDDLRPAFARKLIARYGLSCVEEKLALLEVWLRDKRRRGEKVTPLRAFLDALAHDWPAPAAATARDLDPVAATRVLLQRLEDARREAAPPEVALVYLREIRQTLRRGVGP